MRQPTCRRLHRCLRTTFWVCRYWPGLFIITPSGSARCASPIRLYSKGSSLMFERLQPQQSRASRMAELRISVADTIDAVNAGEWDACADPHAGAGNIAGRAGNGQALPSAAAEAEEQAYNPFISHAFLSALEQSNSVGARTGWQPQHVVARTAEGDLVAAAPCYLKGHSRGEYVFDHGWAEAYARAGGNYYPKLQVAVPFTPATGRRLLVRETANAENIARGLAGGLVEICNICGASGVHVTFAPEEEFRLLGELGYLQRTDQQFHWENRDFSKFDDFLGALTARKRKTIRRERHDALAG